MKRTDFIEKSLRRDRFMVIGTRCEMAGKEKDLIRSTADDVFDLMAEFYEDGFGEETFDFMMDIITEFVSMREYGLALIIQDMGRNKPCTVQSGPFGGGNESCGHHEQRAGTQTVCG